MALLDHYTKSEFPLKNEPALDALGNAVPHVEGKNDTPVKLPSWEQAVKTGRWAKIMTKWLITFSMKVGKKWHFLSFEGAGGGESRGIADFIAIRRNHKFFENEIKIGDYFEIILIQVKGGSAHMPTPDDISRLSKVREYYHAKRVILSSWKKRKSLELYNLVNTSWEPITPKDAFK